MLVARIHQRDAVKYFPEVLIEWSIRYVYTESTFSSFLSRYIIMVLFYY